MGCTSSAEPVFQAQVNANGEIRHTKRQLVSLIKYAPHFIARKTPNEKDEVLMCRNWEDVSTGRLQAENDPTTVPASAVVQFYDLFFKNLYEIAPQTKPVFRSSMHVQSKALINIVGAIRNILHSEDASATIGSLAYRHIKYGVKLEFFDFLGTALIKTLKHLSGKTWNKEIEESWHTVIAFIIYLIVPTYLAAEAKEASKSSSIMRSIGMSSVSRRGS